MKRKAVLLTAAGVLAAVLLALFVVRPALTYKNAETLAADGRYEEAAETFAALGGYRDAEERILPCRYDAACALLHANAFAEAAEAFAALGEYKDAPARVSECRYAQAETLRAAESYAEAAEAFAALGQYEDAPARVTECNYAEAERLLQAGDAEGAKALFVALGEAGEVAKAYFRLEALGETPGCAEAMSALREQDGVLRLFGCQLKDIVTFGTYEQDGDESNGAEPMEWLVVQQDTENGLVLLLNRYCIDNMPFNQEAGASQWKDCSLRKWLNGEFLENSFTEQERSFIPLIEVKDTSNIHRGGGSWEPACGYYTSISFDNGATWYDITDMTDAIWTGGDGNAEDTQDKVYLLSETEAMEWLDLGGGLDAYGSGEVVAWPTAYAISHGAAQPWGSVIDAWWTRTPALSPAFTITTSDRGCISHYGTYNHESHGVRPCLWVSLNAIRNAYSEEPAA